MTLRIIVLMLVKVERVACNCLAVKGHDGVIKRHKEPGNHNSRHVDT